MAAPAVTVKKDIVATIGQLGTFYDVERLFDENQIVYFRCSVCENRSQREDYMTTNVMDMSKKKGKV